MSDTPILYMDHAFRPYRSMSRAGLMVVLGVFLAIGATLGPKERADFAGRLQAAIRTALAERHA